jgi:hypothetical protein
LVTSLFAANFSSKYRHPLTVHVNFTSLLRSSVGRTNRRRAICRCCENQLKFCVSQADTKAIDSGMVGIFASATVSLRLGIGVELCEPLWNVRRAARQPM